MSLTLYVGSTRYQCRTILPDQDVDAIYALPALARWIDAARRETVGPA